MALPSGMLAFSCSTSGFTSTSEVLSLQGELGRAIPRGMRGQVRTEREWQPDCADIHIHTQKQWPDNYLQNCLEPRVTAHEHFGVCPE